MYSRTSRKKPASNHMILHVDLSAYVWSYSSTSDRDLACTHSQRGHANQSVSWSFTYRSRELDRRLSGSHKNLHAAILAHRGWFTHILAAYLSTRRTNDLACYEALAHTSFHGSSYKADTNQAYIIANRECTRCRSDLNSSHMPQGSSICACISHTSLTPRSHLPLQDSPRRRYTN